MNEFLVLFNDSFMVLEIGHNGFWNSTMCLEDWIDDLCIEQDKARVTSSVAIIVSSGCTLNTCHFMMR